MGFVRGRSTNLALSTRGIVPLREAGVLESVSLNSHLKEYFYLWSLFSFTSCWRFFKSLSYSVGRIRGFMKGRRKCYPREGEINNYIIIDIDKS